MPIYHYRCESCAHEFNVTQKMMDDPIKYCEACKGPVYRLISGGVGISFKGDGFHINDYQGKGEKTTPSASSETKK